MVKNKLDLGNDIASMFNMIAFRYDFLNHFFSFGIDRCWRKKSIKIISGIYNDPMILDVASGTGDLAIAAMKLGPSHITGIDISEKMLDIGKQKIKKRRLDSKIDMKYGDSCKIEFPSESFDIVMSAFGVRNFPDPVTGLREMVRVARCGGLIMILEFSKPSAFPLKQLYMFYFFTILPVVGRIVSGAKGAYRYLPESVMRFPDNELFVGIMKRCGLTSVKQFRMTGGIATIYTGKKI